VGAKWCIINEKGVGKTGIAWRKHAKLWGDMTDKAYRNGGLSALQACCGCGGGNKNRNTQNVKLGFYNAAEFKLYPFKILVIFLE